MKNDFAISVQGLSKSYKMYKSPVDRIKEFLYPGKQEYHQKFWALKNVNFDVQKGKTYGIIGQNGSGKSTLLQIISGIIRPTIGHVEVSGRVSALLELGAGFHMDFSGIENVYMQGALMGLSRDEMDNNLEAIKEFADIGEFIDQPVKTYSSGMYVRLAFATAVNINPEILIIDEVLAVGDDMFRRRCFSKLEEFQDQGKTIIFVSHDIETVTSICNEALLIDQGEIVQIGTPRDITNIYGKLLTEREEQYLKWLNSNKDSKTQPSVINDENFEKTDEDSDSEYRYGSGGAEIISIELLNHNKEKSNIFNQGKEFTIKIKVLFKKKITDPLIGYRIRTITGTDVTATSTSLMNAPVGEVEKGYSAELEFSQLMSLNQGSYILTSGIGEEISKQVLFHDRRMDAIVFKVINESPKSGGLVDMDTKVQITIEKPERS